ncbi:MAG: GAF domain-containing protein, partial [Verrucomicrobiota bacterium]
MRILISLAAIVLALPIKAQIANPAANAPAPAPLTQVQQVRALSREEAQRELPVRLRVVVTHFDPFTAAMFVQDETGGVYVRAPVPEFRVAAGQLIELEGFTGSGIQHRVVTRPQVKILGEAPLPKPQQTTFERVFLGQDAAQWVELATVVEFVEYEQGRLLLTLRDNGVHVKAAVLAHDPDDPKLKRLVDARVRLQGVCATYSRSTGELIEARLLLPSLEQLKVEMPAPTRPFDRILKPASELNKLTRPTQLPDRRVHVRGEVVEISGDGFRVRDATGELAVNPLPGAMLRQGDRVDVLGFAGMANGTAYLKGALYRVLAPATNAPAVSTNLLVADGGKWLMPVLSDAATIRQLEPTNAAARLPVRLRGQVTYAEPETRALFVEDSTAGIQIKLAEDEAWSAKAGQLVEVEGATAMGHYAPIVAWARVKITGEAPLPRTETTTTLSTLTSGRHDSQWTEIRGTVRSVTKSDGVAFLMVSTTGVRVETRLLLGPGEPAPEHLVDAEVRVRGVCESLVNAQRQLVGVRVLVPRLEEISVEKAAPDDPFAAAALPVASLGQFRPRGSASHRLHVRGVVTFYRAGMWVGVADGTGHVLVGTRQTDALEPGDMVEVAGFSSREPRRLEDAIYRKTGRQAPPAPEVLTTEQTIDAWHDAALVELEGYLLEKRRHRGELALTVQSGNVTMLARLEESRAGDLFTRLANGSRLRLRGVCQAQVEDNNRSFGLLLRSADDVAVVAGPSWWTPQRTGLALTLFGAVLLLGAGWVAALRGSVRRQTAVIAEQLQREAAFTNLGEKLNVARTPLEAARVIVDVAQELLGWDACSLDLHLSEAEGAQPVLNIDTIDGRRVEVPAAYQGEQASPFVRTVMAEGAKMILRQNESERPAGLVPFGDAGRRSASLLFVPIRNGRRVIGLLSVQSYQHNAYDKDDLVLLQSLADHCGGALERIHAQAALQKAHDALEHRVQERTAELVQSNASLQREVEERTRAESALQQAHDELEQHVQERTAALSLAVSQLRQEIAERRDLQEQLATIHRFGQAINRLASPQEILHLIVDMLWQLMDTSNLSIALYDEASQTISFPIYQVRGRPHPARTRRFANGLTEHVIRTRAPLLITSNLPDELSRLGIEPHGQTSKCYLGVPMMVGEKVVGVIATQDYDDEAAYNQAHVQLFGTVAAEAAIALENGRLYAKVEAELAERTQAERALKSSEQRFSRAFQASPVSVAISTFSTGRFLDINDSFLRLFEYQREEVIGKTALELGLWVDPADRQRLLRMFGEGHSVRDVEFQFRTKTGKLRHALVAVEQIELGGESCLLFITHDISERLNLENQLRHSQKMEAVGQLAAGVAHDFNNLLTVVTGHTSLLQAEPGFNEETRDSLGEIAGAAEKAAGLTRQLLTFSRKQ